jgi:pimeloyl-ACP methyl ester carboxylesterase
MTPSTPKNAPARTSHLTRSVEVRASLRRAFPMRVRTLLGCAFCVLAIAACSDRATPARRIALTECRLPKLAQAVQCGHVDVPENRAHPGSRRLSIFVAVLPANTLSPKPDPLVLIAGGPGQAASSLGAFARQLNDVRRTRDIVLVDQRGTGRSSPLDCPAFAPDEHAEFDTDAVPKATACASQLAAKGVDAAQYTTSAFVADLDDVRKALDYERMNLWGGSYGTRVAQEYLRRHPDRVRSVVLDGVAPASLRIAFDVWPTRDEAVDRVIDACKASAACAKAHPDIGDAIAALRRDLAAGHDVIVHDPRTGAERSMRIDFDTVLAALQPLTYAPEAASLVPELIALARRHEYAPLFAASLTVVGDLPSEFSPALYYSVTCAEDVSRVTPGERANGVGDARIATLAKRAIAVCDHWPKGTFPPDFATPVQSEVPILLLSGGLDPVTPPAYAAEVAKHFPNSRQVVAPGFGHIVSPQVCAPRLIAAFVDAAGFARLPQPCIDFLAKTKPPPTWPDRLAPQASP